MTTSADQQPTRAPLTQPPSDKRGRTPRKAPAVFVLLIATIALLMPSAAVAAGPADTNDYAGHLRSGSAPLPPEPDWFIDESSLPFEPLSITDVAATQHWGVLRAAGYRIEIPANWNGELIMFAHGYKGEDARLFLSPAEGWIDGDTEAEFPDEYRKWMLEQGYAWAQSTYAKNSYNVTQGLRDTNRLVRHFRRNYGRPNSVYIAGFSMGGHISAVAAEQFPQIYSAAMPMCGSVGDYELFDYYLDINVAGQQLGLGSSQFPAADDYMTADLPAIKDALGMNVDPDTWFLFNELPLTEAGRQYKQLLELQSGGDRPNFDEGFIFWNSVPTETGVGNFLWDKGLGDGTITGRRQVVRDNSDEIYQVDLDPTISPFEQQLNDEIARVEPGRNARVKRGLRNPPPVTGRLRMPVLTLHNLGDLFVPFNDEIVYAQDAANRGRSHLLVQRAIRGASHCDFTPNEMIDGMTDLIDWSKTGQRPAGDTLSDPGVVAQDNYGCRFTQNDSYGHLLATPC